MSKSVAALCAALVGAAALSGCAAGANRSLTSRFVKPGAPATDLGGPPPAHGQALRRQIDQAVQRAASEPSAKSSWGVRMENTDPALAASLLLELMLPSPEHQVGVAGEYRRLGILDAAYERLTEALAGAPRLAEAHEMLARIWRDWQLPEKGLGPAYRAVYFDPRSASARNTLGTILERLGQIGAARQAYEAAAARAPWSGWPLNNLCHLELSVGRLDDARARCEAALTRQPDLSAAHNNLALTFAASGNLERAAQEFRAAGDAAAASYNLGIVYLAEGRYESAAEQFEAAVKARPTFTAAKARAHAARMRMLSGGE